MKVKWEWRHGTAGSRASFDEHAQSMAAHESPRTSKLYDRTKERLTQDEIGRIVIRAET
jgi:hypothetical protein